MTTLFLCGAGNSEGVRLALRVRDAGGRWDQVVLLDDDPATHGSSRIGVEVVGPFECLADADPSRDRAVNLVARTTGGRQRAADRIASFGVPLTGLVAPGVDTFGAEVAPDVLVYPGAAIGPEVAIGPGSVVFMGAVVGHEARVGPGCVIAANAVLNARVELGEAVYVGANATILPEIGVGDGATIGAGSTVVTPVPAGATVMGVPARVLLDTQPAGRTEPTPPDVTADQVESALVAAWAEALEVDTIGPDAHVFDLGATSLAALQVSERLGRELGIDVEVIDIFRFGTARELARHLASSSPGRVRPRHLAGAATRRFATEERGESDDDLMEAITTVFRDVLGVPDAGPDSHFFQLGGDPTLAQNACRLLQHSTRESLCFMQVARFPTPRELADHLETARGESPHCPARGMMNRLIHRHERQRG
jgi:acetyltransferase-like isoleucine patch superfamily enzyme/acyl carrier protein